MKNLKIKQGLLAGVSFSFPIVLPIALVACGEDEGITQTKVDAEQAKINALGGTKKYTTSKIIELANEAHFTSEVATKFGVEGFSPQADFTYVYSHPLLIQDGTLNLMIIVKSQKLTSTNPVTLAIDVEGIDMGMAQTILDSVNETKISGLDKTKFASDNANANPQIISTPNATISVKTPRDDQNTYELEITVNVNGKILKKTITITGFLRTPSQQIAFLTKQGAEATTQSKWETYIDALSWTSDGDKMSAKNALSWWPGGGSSVKYQAFANYQEFADIISLINDPVLPQGFNLPSNLISIDNQAFLGVTLPNGFAISPSVTFINSYAFNSAKLPSGFLLPSSISTIKTGTFSRAMLPENFVLPSSITKIEDLAFNNATLAKGFVIPSTVTNIASGAFGGVKIGNLRWVYLNSNGQPDLTRPASGPVAGTALVE